MLLLKVYIMMFMSFLLTIDTTLTLGTQVTVTWPVETK